MLSERDKYDIDMFRPTNYFFSSLFVISQLDQNNLSFNTRARPKVKIKWTAIPQKLDL